MPEDEVRTALGTIKAASKHRLLGVEIDYKLTFHGHGIPGNDIVDLVAKWSAASSVLPIVIPAFNLASRSASGSI
jgi:hypothetical protein